MSYIFNINLSRTGSSSLTRALNILNFPSVHYRYRDTKLKDIISKNNKFGNNMFDNLPKEIVGFSDFGGHKVYEELYRQYPLSKYIFTYRDYETWKESYLALRKTLQPKNFVTKKDYDNETERAHKHYFLNTTNIRSFFQDKQEQYLEVDICNGEGWDRLCNFLNVDIPLTSFPLVNARDQMISFTQTGRIKS